MGQLLAGPARAAAIERHDQRALRHHAEQPSRFLPAPERRAPRPLGLPDFALDHRAVAAEAPEVIVARGAIGRPELPHREQMGFHPFSLLAPRSSLLATSSSTHTSREADAPPPPGQLTPCIDRK